MNETVTLSNLSNEEFLAKYARPGRVGLSGGITLIDRAIQMAERQVIEATYRKHQGHRGKTAAELGIALTTLRRKLRDYGLG